MRRTYQRFYRPMHLILTCHVASCSFIPLGQEKPLCMDSSIVARAMGLRFFSGHFLWPSLSHISDLQNGIGFVLLREGHKKCPEKNCTPIAWAMIELSMHNGFSWPSGMRLQLATWHVWSRCIGL